MSPSRMAGPHCPNPAQEPERESDTPLTDKVFSGSDPVYEVLLCRQFERDLSQAKALAESYRRAMNSAKDEMEHQSRRANAWRSLAIDAVAAAKACLLALPVADTERWQAIKDVEERLEAMEKL